MSARDNRHRASGGGPRADGGWTMGPEFAAEAIPRLLVYVERTPDLVGVVDERGKVLYLNSAALERLGRHDYSGLTTADIFAPEAFERYYREVRPAIVEAGAWSGELPVMTASGVSRAMRFSIVGEVLPGGEVTALAAHGREVFPGAEVGAPAWLVPDELTGLVGRSVLTDHARVALARAVREGQHIAAVFVDVDAMKHINDTYGHAAGDDVLRVSALRMARAVRGADTVARVGGDEFVVLFDGVLDENEALLLAERVRAALVEGPIVTVAGELPVSASFGVALDKSGDRPSDLLGRADAAMYRAKALGGARVVDSDLQADAGAAGLAEELPVAISQGMIQPYVQPVVDLRTSETIGLQGFARWKHETRGILEARAFIDLVANTPMSPVVDLSVMRGTAAAVRRAARDGGSWRVYSHLSRSLIGDRSLEHYLAEIAHDNGLQAEQLFVEVGQRLVTRRSKAVEGALRALREAGARVVLSGVDKGCGVNDVVEHGFDEVRLSPSLVSAATIDAGERRALRGAVGLARSLGLSVIAVGVETEQQRAELLDAGCDLALGLLYGGPIPARTAFA